MASGKTGSKWCQTFVFGTNLLLHLLLFIFFLAFFGVPSIEKYLAKKTIVISSEEQTKGIEAPAITFVAQTGWIGWKTANESMEDPTTSFDMVDHCQRLNTTDMESCISRDTFQSTDFLREARLGFYKEEHSFLSSESSASFWTEDITIPFMGRHFTLKPSQKITRNSADTPAFLLNANFSYSIFVHDENFFLINYNPIGLPNRVWMIKGEREKGGGYYYQITLTKHKRLNLDGRPCEEDLTYNFNTCIKEKLSAKVGCRLPWDTWSQQEREVCATDQQFREFGKFYTEFMIAVMQEITEITGCKKPCSYNEYKFLTSTPLENTLTKMSKDQIFISFWAVSPTTQVLMLKLS